MTLSKSSESGSTVGVVHAKAHSRRVPGKNFRMLGDAPLIVHAIRAGLSAREIDHVVIDSEDEQLLEIGKEAGAEPMLRPSYLAGDSITGHELAWAQACALFQFTIIVQIVPTSPFILPATIDSAVLLCKQKKLDSVIGMRAEKLYRHENGRPVYDHKTLPGSDELEATHYETTGLYVFRREYAIRAAQRFNPQSCGYVWLSRVEAIDINEEEDWQFLNTPLVPEPPFLESS